MIGVQSLLLLFLRGDLLWHAQLLSGPNAECLCGGSLRNLLVSLCFVGLIGVELSFRHPVSSHSVCNPHDSDGSVASSSSAETD